MADDLGARLVQAGLVTRGQLARALGSAPPHDGALVAGLTEDGLDEDALAGFFVAAGFGPLMTPRDLAAAEPRALERLSASMAHGLLALPIKESVAGLVIAMAAPSDPHAVRELSRIARAPVLPTVARVRELRGAIAAAYPSTPTRERPPPRVSEPPVLELVQRKKKAAPPPASDPTPPMGSVGYGDSTRGAARVEARALVGPRLVADDEEGFVPLVRHKAVAPAERPRKITRDFERAGSGAAPPTGVESGSGTGTGAGKEPGTEDATGSETPTRAGAGTGDAATAGSRTTSRAGGASETRASAATPNAGRDAARPGATTRVGFADSPRPSPIPDATAKRADAAAKRAARGSAARAPAPSPLAPSAPGSSSRPSASPTPAPSPSRSPSPWSSAGSSPTSPASPSSRAAIPPAAGSPARSPSPTGPKKAPAAASDRDPAPVSAPAPASDSVRAPRGPRSIIPPEHARWDVDAKENKVAPESLARLSDTPPKRPARPAPIGGTLSAIRASRERDEVVELACQGALSVSRAVVLLALRKNVLKGWGGAGVGLSRDAVKNLWIPTSSPSIFRTVLTTQRPYSGPHGHSAADGLFRAALGCRGGEVMVMPVFVSNKIVALLAADEIRFRSAGRERVEILAKAAGEALERIVVSGARKNRP